MVFSSVEFLFVFLPIALVFYHLSPHKARNAVLLVISAVFYIWGGGAFIFILCGSIFANWGIALLISRHARMRVAGVTLAVCGNIALLFYFKYANFFVAQINTFRAYENWGPFAWASVLLPIGISFITFHALSYIIDVARGKSLAFENPFDFALYILLFPQLIAGPIVRYSLIADQIRKKRVITFDMFANGAVRFCHGLAKKVIVADSVAAFPDVIFRLPADQLTTATAWIAALGYTIQIYFDFSGYSDMAIGLGQMFGFRLPENFNRPYSALSITDFWRRWHMTLSNWFRDYLFIPLGGSKGSILRTGFNLWIVFLLCGFWHGASWTFVAWGAYHGFLLFGERIFNARYTDEAPRFPALHRAAVTFLVLIGWVLFRAASIAQAFSFYNVMFGKIDWRLPAASLTAFTNHNICMLILSIAVFFMPRDLVMGRKLEDNTHMIVARYALLCVLFPVAICMIVAGTYSPFLYFQF